MSFDKRYQNRKDHRRPYYDSRRFDYTCRNHGSCPYCTGGRLFASVRRQPADLQLQIKLATTTFAECEEYKNESRVLEFGSYAAD